MINGRTAAYPSPTAELSVELRYKPQPAGFRASFGGVLGMTNSWRLIFATIQNCRFSARRTLEKGAYVAQPRTPSMLSALSENWWALALRGLLAVLFGFAALFLPLDTLAAVGRVFGAYAISEGMLVVLIGMRGPDTGERLSPKGRPASGPDWLPSPGPASPRSCSCTSSPSGRYSAAPLR
jgi:short repeat uncharacterized protein DUF308